jgi:monoamine oxidase
MTELQLDNEIYQSQQDVVTLDYAKWSFQQRQSKLPTSHELWQQERDRTLARQQSANAEARARYLNKLDDERAAKQSEYDAEIDRELEPQKQRLMREWLANNPTFTASDFEKKAWIYLRQNLMEKRDSDAMEATRRGLLESGRYSL